MSSSEPTALTTLERLGNVPGLRRASITISVDCEDILKPDTETVGTYTFQSGSEAMEHLQLHHLIYLPILSQIKIKLIHTCGSLIVKGEPCLQALWNVGDKLAELYTASGRAARYERWTNKRSKDWLEVDAKVVVYLDCTEGV